MKELFLDINFKQADFALKADASFPLEGIVVITGASGSGKSSLLKCIAGLKKTCSGEIKFDNFYWQSAKKNIFIETHLRKIGFIFQESSLFPHLNAQQNILYGEKRKHNKTPVMDKEYIVEKLNIRHLLHKMPRQLSGGEKQKIAIARTLVNSPDLILMDEPLSSIDDEAKIDIIQFLNEIKKFMLIPMIFVTHSEMEKECLADRHFVMRNGILS